MIISTGGEKNDNVLKTVQYTDNGGSTFHSLPDMPEGRMKHSVASLEKGNIFVFGGDDESRKSSQTCFFYKSARNEWITCPAIAKSVSHACYGVVNNDDGEEEVVVVGAGFFFLRPWIFSPQRICNGEQV
jgi:hypothetical protein